MVDLWGQHTGITWPQLVVALLGGGGAAGLGAWVLNLLAQKRKWEAERVQQAEQVERRKQEWIEQARENLHREYDHFFDQMKASNAEFQNTINGLRKQLAAKDQECDELMREQTAKVEELRRLMEQERTIYSTRISKLQIILGELQAENSLQRTQIQEMKAGSHPLLVTTEREEGIVFTNAEGKIGYANPRTHSLFRYPPGSLLGRNVRDLVPPAVREEHDRRMARAFRDPVAALELAKVRPVYGLTRTGIEIPLSLSLTIFEMDDRWFCRAVFWVRYDPESRDNIPVYQDEQPPQPQAPIPVVIANPPTDPVPTKVVDAPENP